MYKGRVDVSIQVIVFNQDGSVLETHSFNPYTNQPFKDVEEAEEFLKERLSELNSSTPQKEKEIKIYVVDVKSGEKISNGVVGQEVKLIVETNTENIPTIIYIPIIDQLSNRVFIVSAKKVDGGRWESNTFPLNTSGLFNIDETRFKPINKLPDDIRVNAYDVVVADV